MKLYNLFGLDTLTEIAEKFSDTNQDDIELGFEYFDDFEVENFTEMDNEIYAVVHVNHVKKFIVKAKHIDQASISISCSCTKIGQSKLCSHIIAVWHEYHYSYNPEAYPFHSPDLLDFDIGEDDGYEEEVSEMIFNTILSNFFSSFSEDELNNLSTSVLDRLPSNRFRDFRYFNDYRFIALVKYDPGINFTPTRTNLSKQQFTKYRGEFNKLDESAKFGLYLLLGNDPRDVKLFKKYYVKFVQEFYDEPLLQYNKFIQNTPYVIINEETIDISNSGFKKFLHDYFGSFTLQLTSNKQSKMGFSPGLIHKPSEFDIIPVIHLIINTYNSAKTVITTKQKVFKSVLKTIMGEIKPLLPQKYNTNQILYIIELITIVSFYCEFISLQADRSISINSAYFEFLALSHIDQRIFIRDQILKLLIDSEGRMYELNVGYAEIPTSWAFDQLNRYLAQYLDMIYHSEIAPDNHFIPRSQILFDIFKRDFEVAEMDVPNYELDLSSFQLLELSEEDFRPSIDEFDIPGDTQPEALLNLIDFILPLLGVLGILQDKNNQIRGYQLNYLAELEEKTKMREKETDHEKDVYLLPDFTIKGSRTSFTSDQLNWLTRYTNVEKIDNLIEAKLEKEYYWNYLEKGSSKTQESFIEQLQELVINDVPDPILTEIDNWTKSFGYIQKIKGQVFVIPEPGLIDHIMDLKTMKNVKFIRIAPTIIVVPSDKSSKLEKYLTGKEYHITSVDLDT